MAGASTPTTASSSTATTSSASKLSYIEGRRRSLPANTKSAWSSSTTAAASAKGGTVTLYLDGKKDGEGRVDMTIPMVYLHGRDLQRRQG